MLDVDPDAVRLFQPQIDALLKRLEVTEEEIAALKAKPDGSALFAARDNLETALFSAMQGMSDAEQTEFLNRMAGVIADA